MHDLFFRPLTRDGLTLIRPWFADSELGRRISAPTEQWFDYVSAGQGNFAWLVCEENQAIGLIQLDTETDQTGSVSLVVNPKLRHCGCGRRILSVFLGREEARCLIEIEACIETDNTASLRCFQAGGFKATEMKPHDGLVTYVFS